MRERQARLRQRVSAAKPLDTRLKELSFTHQRLCKKAARQEENIRELEEKVRVAQEAVERANKELSATKSEMVEIEQQRRELVVACPQPPQPEQGQAQSLQQVIGGLHDVSVGQLGELLQGFGGSVQSAQKLYDAVQEVREAER
eukprot:4401791-Pyramimonas_sp.AAC.1